MGTAPFSTHIVHEAALEHSIIYEFDNTTRDGASGLFPFANRQRVVIDETTFDRGGEQVLRAHYLVREPRIMRSEHNPRVLFPFDHVVRTRVEDIVGSARETVSSATSERTVDEFGNLTHEVMEMLDGVEREETTIHYKHESDSSFEDAWLINLPVLKSLYSSGLIGTSQQSGYTREVALDYDANGLLASTTVEPEDGEFEVTKTFLRNVHGNLESVTTVGDDETRVATVLQYDERNVFPRVVEDAEGYQTAFDVNGRLGTVVKVTTYGRDGDGPGLARYNVTDGFGRTRVAIEEDGRVAHTAYSVGTDGASGMLVSTDAPGFPASSAEYDVRGREILRSTQVLGGQWLRLQARYDHFGRAEFVTRPSVDGTLPDRFLEGTATAYDNLGRRVGATNADGTERRTCYDGNVTCEEDELHRVTCFERDGRGRVTFASDPVAAAPGDCHELAAGLKLTPVSERDGLAYGFGPFGFLERVTRWASGQATLLTDARADRLGRLRTRKDLGVAEKAFSYTAFGKLETVTTAEHLITWQYDALDRARFRTDGAGTSEWLWRDDMAGRVEETTTSAPARTVKTAVYDDLGRVSSVTRVVDGETFSVGVAERDEFGRATVVSYPSTDEVPFQIENVYDPASGMLSEVWSVSLDASQPRTRFWKVDELTPYGQLEHETFGNDLTTKRTYHEFNGRPRTIVTAAGADAVQQLELTFYDNGNVDTREDSIVSRFESFTYDPLDRVDGVALGGEEVAAPRYTDLGSIQRNTKGWAYSYDLTNGQAVDHITDGGLRSDFSYSSDGHLTHRSAGLLPELNVEYTSFGKPKRQWGVDEAQATVIGYDAEEQKVSSAGPGLSTVYFDELYYRVDAADPARRVHHYVVSNGLRAVAEVQRVDGETAIDVRYLHDDHLGSVVALTDSAGQATRQDFDYFGSRGEASFTNLGFTGHHDEGPLGLIDMRGRTYDPEVGQFLSPDPLVAQPFTTQGFNRYSYANNNPLRFTDPSGFQQCDELSASCVQSSPEVSGPSPFLFSDTVGGGVVSITGNAPPGGGVGSVLSTVAGAGDPSDASDAFSVESSAGSGAAASAAGQENGALAAPPIWDPRNTPRPTVGPNLAPPDLEDYDLAFNGQELVWYAPQSPDPAAQHRPVIGRWGATSGRPGYSSPRNQMLRNRGPIPEGLYRVRIHNLQRYNDLSAWDRFRGTFGRGPWPGGTRAWGNWRIWLEPMHGTDTMRRSGFSIHGGATPGSAGCIDLCGGMESFADAFRRNGTDLVLRVAY